MFLSTEWLDYEKELGFRPLITGTYQEIRTSYHGLSESIAAKLPRTNPDLQVYDEKISEAVSLRIYVPKQGKLGQKLPLGVYAHGGGFVTGSVDASFEDYNCRYIAETTPCIVVSVDFRLAPEHLVPAQADDVLQGFLWASENCEQLGGDKSQIFLIGASVGGGLALSVAFRLLEEGRIPNVRGIVALAPITLHPEHVPENLKETFVAYEENADGPLIDRAAMFNFNAQNGCNEAKDNPDVFPALQTRWAELPPVYIATCGADPLRDDGTVVYHSLKKAGIQATLKNYPGMPHFFWIFPEIKTGEIFRADTVQGIHFVLEKQ